MSKCLLLILLCSAGLVTPILGREARQQQRIDYLLQWIGSMENAKFIRNAQEYDARAAESHLRQKLSYGGERIQTAEQFIEFCASTSSMSKQPYQIRFADGKIVETGPYLRAKLAEFDQSKMSR